MLPGHLTAMKTLTAILVYLTKEFISNTFVQVLYTNEAVATSDEIGQLSTDITSLQCRLCRLGS